MERRLSSSHHARNSDDDEEEESVEDDDDAMDVVDEAPSSPPVAAAAATTTTTKTTSSSGKSAKIVLPVEVTLEASEKWTAGQRPQVAKQSAIAVKTVPRKVFPPRARQNVHTLLPAGVTATDTRSIMELISHSNAWYTYSPPEILRSVIAPRIREDAIMSVDYAHATSAVVPSSSSAAAAASASSRALTNVALGNGPNNATHIAMMHERGLLSPEERTHPGRNTAAHVNMLVNADRERRMFKFFEDDPMPPDEEPYHMKPESYPILQLLNQTWGARFERRNTNTKDLGALPHPVIETINKRYFYKYRLPPIAPERACVSGVACQFMRVAQSQGHPQYGYIAREFLTPNEEFEWNRKLARDLPVTEENYGPPKKCIDCLLAEWTRLITDHQQTKQSPMEPFNHFSVLVGQGEYAAEFVIRGEMNGIPTGVSGAIPQYLATKREYVTVKPENSSGTITYLAEVGMDFQCSLSKMNACLGTFKVSPLVGDDRWVSAYSRHVFLPPATLDAHLQSDPVFERSGWRRFTRGLFMPLLVDRHLTRLDNDDNNNSGSTAARLAVPRLPVLWLRQFFQTRNRYIILPTKLQWIAHVMGGINIDAHHVADEIHALADLTFCSFERTMAHWPRIHQSSVASILIKLATTSRHDEWRDIGDEFLGMPPDMLLDYAAAGRRDPSSPAFIISVTLWRWMFSIFMETSLIVTPDRSLSNELVYRSRLFRDTHLDLLVYALARGQWSDAWFLAAVTATAAHETPPPPSENKTGGSQKQRRPVVYRENRPRLVAVYPQVNRVVCSEELPDLAPALLHSGFWFDLGNRKGRNDIFITMMLLFIIKLNPQKCQRRQYISKMTHTELTFPVIREMRLLVIQTMLLCNIRSHLAHMRLVTRIRIRASFGERARVDLLEALKTNKMISRSLLSGYTMDGIIENHPAIRHLTFASKKWQGSRAIIRNTNALICEEINNQVKDTTNVISLDRLETKTTFSGKNDAVTTGLVMSMHDRTLPLFNKLKKGRFEELLRKKMIGIEKRMVFDEAECIEWLLADNRMQYLFLVTWVIAQRSHHAASTPRERGVIDTRYLKALGMSKEALIGVRQWLFDYYEYEPHDNGFGKKAIQLFAERTHDYVLLKTYLVMIEYYRNKRIFILSARETARAIQACRNSARIEQTSATPPRLGKAYYCEGCMRFANDIVTAHPIVSGDVTITKNGIQQERARLSEGSSPGNDDELAFRSNAADSDICSLRACFYQPITGQLHCRRYNTIASAAYSNNSSNTDVTPDGVRDSDDDGEGANTNNDDDDDDMVTAIGEEFALATGEASIRNLALRLTRDVELATPPVRKRTNNIVRTAVAKAGEASSCLRGLQEIDMLGIYFRTGNKFVGTCVYCGRLTEVRACHLTNQGLSCGKHIIASEYPDYHRIWLSWGVTRREAMAQLTVAPKPTRACFKCGMRNPPRGTTRVEVVDNFYRRSQIYLCLLHAVRCVDLIPVVDEQRATQNIPPVRLVDIVDRLK